MPFAFGAGAAVVVERDGLFHPTFVKVMTDPFAGEADEVKTVDALVDLFPVEHAAAKFFDADAEKLFVIFLYLASSGFVTWKIFVIRLIVRAVIDIVMAPVFAAAGAFSLPVASFSKLP